MLVGLLLVEVFFRVWAAAVGHEDPTLTGDDSIVVLCIGDSHTWGRGAGYPQLLAERLAERSSRYRVVNLGVPGTNTAQLRRRLPEQLDRYRPALLVVWSGVNNSWNLTDAELRSGAGGDPGWRLSDYSRIARFFRVWRHQRTLRRLFEERGAYLAPEVASSHEPGVARFERSLGDDSDTYVNRSGSRLAGEELVAATRDDLVWIVTHARERGVPTVLVAYGLPGGPYGDATLGIRAAAEATGAPLVEASTVGFELASSAEARGVDPPRLYDESVHPTQPLYAAVGERVLQIADELGLLPGPD